MRALSLSLALFAAMAFSAPVPEPVPEAEAARYPCFGTDSNGNPTTFYHPC